MVRVPSGGSLMSSLRCTSLYFANDVPQTHDAGINRPRAQPGLVRPPHTWEPHISRHRESPGVVRLQSHPTTPGLAKSRSTSLCFVSRFKNPHYAECLQSLAFVFFGGGGVAFCVSCRHAVVLLLVVPGRRRLHAEAGLQAGELLVLGFQGS